MTKELGRDEVARLSAMVDTLAAGLGCSREEAIERVAFVCQRLPLMPDGLNALIRNAQRARLRRNDALDVDFFRDPAWDMLMELFLAKREKRSLSVSALCFASGVPATTALRHVEWMEGGGLITRRGDFDDHRRVLVEIAPGMEERIEALTREIYVDSVIAAAQALAPKRSSKGSIKPAG